MDPSAWLPQRARETPDSYAKRRDGMRIARYTFDRKAAHREIAPTHGAVDDTAGGGAGAGR
eukprot:2055563-Prymnesium_polylepis.1